MIPAIIKDANHETLATSELIHAPLWHHKRRLSYTTTGYGRKIPTEYKIKYNGRTYRIYCCIYSNVGTPYILSKKAWLYVDFS